MYVNTVCHEETGSPVVFNLFKALQQISQCALPVSEQSQQVSARTATSVEHLERAAGHLLLTAHREEHGHKKIYQLYE